MATSLPPIKIKLNKGQLIDLSMSKSKSITLNADQIAHVSSHIGGYDVMKCSRCKELFTWKNCDDMLNSCEDCGKTACATCEKEVFSKSLSHADESGNVDSWFCDDHFDEYQ
jgi:PHP family Zn ribbon phosphoesterase